MGIQQARPSGYEVLERVLDKGIVIDASVRVNVAGIDLAIVDARVVVASLETYLKYATGVTAAMRHEAMTARPQHGNGAREATSLMVVRDAFEALNGHDFERYASLLDESYVGETHGLRTTVRGRAAGSHALDAYIKVLPDFHFVIEGAVAADDDVLVSWLATGTPRDRYNGTRLTSRPLQVPGCTVTRLRDGRIVHAWHYWDTPSGKD